MAVGCGHLKAMGSKAMKRWSLSQLLTHAQRCTHHGRLGLSSTAVCLKNRWSLLLFFSLSSLLIWLVLLLFHSPPCVHPLPPRSCTCSCKPFALASLFCCGLCLHSLVLFFLFLYISVTCLSVSLSSCSIDLPLPSGHSGLH